MSAERDSGARLERLLTALSVASVGNYDEAQALVNVDVAAGDNLAELEQAFLVFLNEIQSTRAAEQKAHEAALAARAELQAKLSTIEQQRQTIQDLSTPIIDLWEGVLTLPIVGVIDTQRALEMTERLLARIVESGAARVIVDLTGVELVDTMTADHIGKMTRSAALLGAECIITGIGPTVARTLVGIGVDLGATRTKRTLREGLKACIDDVARGAPAADAGQVASGDGPRGPPPLRS
jgi:rsbT co-antagonist protein RsbR